MSRRECLNCANYYPTPNDGWKPGYRLKVFDVYDIYRTLGQYPEWNAGWPGKCHANPEPVVVYSVYCCGQWVVNADFLRQWHDLREMQDLRTEVDSLKKQLKAERERSLERYRKLRGHKEDAATMQADA
jgi:hypothetical protein